VRVRLLSVAAVARRGTHRPSGAVQSDDEFEAWSPGATDVRPVRLSELFADDKDTLLLSSFVFIPGDEGLPLAAGCPHCTSIIGGIDGELPHITDRINFPVVAKAPIERIHAHAQVRAWRQTRLLPSANTTINRDAKAEGTDGNRLPIAAVFIRRGGAIHHFWSSDSPSRLPIPVSAPGSTSYGPSGRPRPNPSRTWRPAGVRSARRLTRTTPRGSRATPAQVSSGQGGGRCRGRRCGG